MEPLRRRTKRPWLMCCPQHIRKRDRGLVEGLGLSVEGSEGEIHRETWRERAFTNLVEAFPERAVHKNLARKGSIVAQASFPDGVIHAKHQEPAVYIRLRRSVHIEEEECHPCSQAGAGVCEVVEESLVESFLHGASKAPFSFTKFSTLIIIAACGTHTLL